MKVAIVPIIQIEEGTRFREDYGNIAELITSIKAEGLIQPLAVYQKPAEGVDTQVDGYQPYLLLAGGRRFRACCESGVPEVPVRIYDEVLSDDQLRAIELAENIYRKDLTWLEQVKLKKEIHTLQTKIHGEAVPGVRTDLQAEGEKAGWTQKDTANMLGVSPSGLLQDLQLADAVEVVPALAQCKTKSEATKVLAKSYENMLREELAKRWQEQHKSADKRKQDLVNSYILNDFFIGVKDVPDGTIDLCEIDPPYAIDLVEQKKDETGVITDGYNEVPTDQYVIFMDKVISESKRCLKENGWLILWFAPEPWMETLFGLLKKHGFDTHRMCGVWAKGGGQTRVPHIRLGNGYEMFFYARKRNAQIAKPGRSNLFAYPPVPPQKKIHPTERPVALIKDVLETFTLPGSRIMVPFLGSGATLIAAQDAQMTAFGFELNPDYKNAFIARVTTDSKTGLVVDIPVADLAPEEGEGDIITYSEEEDGNAVCIQE